MAGDGPPQRGRHVGVVMLRRGSIDGSGAAISSLARAMFTLRVAVASNP